MGTDEDLGSTRALVMANASKVLVRNSHDAPMEVRGERPIVIVLGMHRSGTSLLSNILHYMGVDMADASDKASPANAKGFWERPELVALQDQVLDVIGRPIRSPVHALPFPPGWWRGRELRPLKTQIRDWVRRQLDEASGPWGFKDPRTCRLLPLWWEILQELGVQAQYVVAVRSPGEAATSMADKNPAARPFTISQGELLWLVYNYDILRHVGGTDPLIVDYTDWFRDPVRQAEAVVRHLKLAPGFSQHELAECLHGVIQPDLRHKFEGEGRAESAFRISVPFYEAILQKGALIAGGEDPTLPHLALLDVVFRCMEPVVELVAEVPQLRDMAREGKALGKRAAELELALEEARAELLAARQDMAAAAADNRDLEARAAAAERALAERGAEGRSAAIGDLPLLTRLHDMAHESRVFGERAAELVAALEEAGAELVAAPQAAAAAAENQALRDRAAAAEAALAEAQAERLVVERGLETLIETLEAEVAGLASQLAARAAPQLVLEGQVDGVQNGKLVGWAAYQSRMDRAVVVEVYVDGVFAAAALATERRSEEFLATKRGGHCGFAIALERLPLDGTDREIRVRAAGSATTLPGSPLRLRQDGVAEPDSRDVGGDSWEGNAPDGEPETAAIALDDAPTHRRIRIASSSS